MRNPLPPRSLLRFASPLALAGLLALALGAAVAGGRIVTAAEIAQVYPGRPPASFEVGEFSVEVLERYWLHFELTSVLLLAAVVATIAVIRTGRRRDG